MDLLAVQDSFTDMLKPVMARLHSSGFISTLFIDDILLIGGSELEFVGNGKTSSHIFFGGLGLSSTPPSQF